MEKWTEQRIAAYKRYVTNEEKDIELFERQLKYKQKEIESLQRAIENASKRRVSYILELRGQGWKRTDDSWENNAQ
ncbi:TPA: hypothetical protein ACGW7B_000525 [Bacillus nitratireducens]